MALQLATQLASAHELTTQARIVEQSALASQALVWATHPVSASQLTQPPMVPSSRGTSQPPLS